MTVDFREAAETYLLVGSLSFLPFTSLFWPGPGLLNVQDSEDLQSHFTPSSQAATPLTQQLILNCVNQPTTLGKTGAAGLNTY
jgi:hypothetical protein